MQFEKISAKSQSQTCIDLRNFPLPFFSMSAIDKYYKEKAIVKQLKNDQKQIIELYDADTITKKDVIRSLNSLLGEYRYYLHIEKLTINTNRNKLARQFRDLRKKLAELEGKQFISSFEF